jgi:hypothetical protein
VDARTGRNGLCRSSPANFHLLANQISLMRTDGIRLPRGRSDVLLTQHLQVAAITPLAVLNRTGCAVAREDATAEDYASIVSITSLLLFLLSILQRQRSDGSLSLRSHTTSTPHSHRAITRKLRSMISTNNVVRFRKSDRSNHTYTGYLGVYLRVCDHDNVSRTT